MYSRRANFKPDSMTCGRSGCAGNSFCLALSEETRQTLCRSKTVRIFAKRRIECFDPVAEKRVMLIRRGELVGLRLDCDGRQKGMDILFAGGLLGISSLFGGKACSPIHFYVRQSVEACLWPTALFEELAVSQPELSRILFCHALTRYTQALEHIQHLALGNTEDKLQFAADRLSGNEGVRYTEARTITHRELAIFAGINRVSATRTIDRVRRQNTRGDPKP